MQIHLNTISKSLQEHHKQWLERHTALPINHFFHHKIESNMLNENKVLFFQNQVIL